MTTQREKDIYVNTILNPSRNIETSGLNKPKARVSSLSSLFSNNVLEDGKHEVFGFRRFARSYLLGSGKNAKIPSSRISNRYEVVDGTCMRSDARFAGINPPPPTLNRIKRRNAQEKAGYIFNMESVSRDHMMKPKGRTFDLDLEANPGLYRLPDLFQDQSGTSLIGEDGTFCTTTSSEYESWISTGRGNSVIFTAIPDNIGVGSILSQVCGGPLARIREYKNESDNKLEELELSFITSEDALSFMRYGRTYLFRVNGVHLTPHWAGSIDIVSAMFDGVSPEDYSDVCRCLVLKKYLVCNVKAKHSGLPKDSLLENVDVNEIRKDFGEFGEILEVAPIVSRKLCISIHFYSVESAIKSMFEYEDPSTFIHKKYFKTWAAWYGKDVTDRPCVLL